jgi:hypothetical protein
MNRMNVPSKTEKSQGLALAEAAVRRMIRVFNLPGKNRIISLEKIPGTYSSIPCAIEVYKGERTVILYIGIYKHKYQCVLKSSQLSVNDLALRISSSMPNGSFPLEPWLSRYKKRQNAKDSQSMPLYRQLGLAREILREFDRAIAKWRNIPSFAKQ